MAKLNNSFQTLFCIAFSFAMLIVVVGQYAVQHNIPCSEVPKHIDFRMNGYQVGKREENSNKSKSQNDDSLSCLWCYCGQLPPEVLNGSFDVGIVVSFGYFLPSSILNHFPHGLYNIHPSLLPQYRGSAPIQYSLWNNDKETGVSILQVTEKMDAGKVLQQQTVVNIQQQYNIFVAAVRSVCLCCAFGLCLACSSFNHLFFIPSSTCFHWRSVVA